MLFMNYTLSILSWPLVKKNTDMMQPRRKSVGSRKRVLVLRSKSEQVINRSQAKARPRRSS